MTPGATFRCRVNLALTERTRQRAGIGIQSRAIAVRKIVTMQNRYVGDIGDYLKLGILRALSPGYRLGIARWLYPDESHNRDGRHIGYLHRPDQRRHYNPKLFDALVQIVSTGHRDIRALEEVGLLPGTIHSQRDASYWWATFAAAAERRRRDPP